MLLSTEHQQLFLAHALEQYPNEACAVVVEHLDSSIDVIPIKNAHPTPAQDFLISKIEVADAVGEGKLLALLHSHTNGNNQPSMVDKTVCEAMGVPWGILVLPQQQWVIYSPSGYIAPLKQRDWAYGYLDCYSIIRDAYRQLNIFLNDYERPPLYLPDGRFSWHADGWDYYSRNFKQEGFGEVNEPRPYDVALMKYQCENENHVGLFLPGGYILHHLLNCRSRTTLWDGDLRQATTRILRHKALSEEVVWGTTLTLT